MLYVAVISIQWESEFGNSPTFRLFADLSSGFLFLASFSSIGKEREWKRVGKGWRKEESNKESRQ